MMDAGLSRLGDVRIGKEDHLLCILRDVSGRCTQLLGVVIKVDMCFIGGIGSMLIFWFFERW